MNQPARITAIDQHQLLLAESDETQVISPFQYYATQGERILRLDLSSHSGSSRHYAHFDADGQIISRLDLGDTGIPIDWATISERESGRPAEFAQLMHEMHVAVQEKRESLSKNQELEKLKKLSPADPIFVVGCGRSGTTLLLAILGAHSEIFPIQEESYAFYPFPFRLTELVREIEAAADQKWTHWCEKTPKHIRAIPEILAAFEGRAKIIHIVRDGRDVVTSHHPNAVDKYYISPERWVADVSAGWQHKKHTLLIRFEDLVQQSEQALQVVSEYLGLEMDAQMLEFEKISPVQANKAWDGGQVQAINEERLARWQAPEHKERVEEFMAYPGARELMNKLDYM